MIDKIDAHGLFAPRQSKVTLEGGEALNLTDFQVIDEPAFNKLSDEAFLDLRKSGALGAGLLSPRLLQQLDIVGLSGLDPQPAPLKLADIEAGETHRTACCPCRHHGNSRSTDSAAATWAAVIG